MGTMKKGILVLDPRTKILLLLGINIYVFTNSYVWAEIIVMAALIILLLLCGVYKAALKSAVTYIALLAIKYFLLPFCPEIILTSLNIVVITFRKLLPCVTLATLLVQTTPIRLLMHALQRWHLPQTVIIPLAITVRYRHDAAYAREHGDLDLYRTSRRANIACKEAIEAAIADNYRDNRLGKDAVPQVVEQFGYTRTLYVLANTVQQKDWDGRFSPANKTWAKTVDIPPNPDGFGSDRNLDFVVDSHSGLVDLFLSQARQEYLRLQPLTPEEIRAEAARLLQELRAPDTPNSPHGTHYMARVSPDFLARAGTQAHDQLMALLPFRSLAITGLVDRPGTYVTILASEDRSKELRQPRRSVRRQLKQEPHPAEKPEKKSSAHKKKEPER